MRLGRLGLLACLAWSQAFAAGTPTRSPDVEQSILALAAGGAIDLTITEAPTTSATICSG